MNSIRGGRSGSTNADLFSCICTCWTCFWQPFYFDCQHICIFHSLHFTTEASVLCVWGELSIIFTLLCCTQPYQHHKTDFSQSVRIRHGRRGETKRRQRGRLERWRKGALCLRRHFINPKCRHLTCMRLNIFVVCLQPVWVNPTDSTFRFNSVWITLIWGEVQLDLYRRVARNLIDTFFFYPLSTFQSRNFLSCTWVKKLKQYFLHTYLYFYLNEECVYFCSLWVTCMKTLHLTVVGSCQ